MDWSLAANRRYDPLRGRTPQIDRLTRPQMAALRRRLGAWDARNLHAASNGEIIAREDYERMKRARARARRRERALLKKIGGIQMRSGSLSETMGAPGQLGALLGWRPAVRPWQATSAAAYRELSKAAVMDSRNPGDAARARQTLEDMLARTPGAERLSARIQRLSAAGVLRLRLDPAVMQAIKDVYLSSRMEEARGVTEVENYIDEAERIR